ncbi:hypothetical protein [Halomonas sp. hl-4]|uniref:hypothetical protein n=1 Tax=Halomonas sp. hl-4 TaxID=1761789 RepID=UPI000BB7E9F2|nr:hypothetical protein [Halomonas sp. hl-4]
MNTTLLTYENVILTPEARWLLMQWATQIGLDQPVECSPQTLFARLGLTYRQGRRAWQVLTCKRGKQQEQFVEIERLPRKGPGRPNSRYRLSAKLVKALAKSTLPISKCHAEEITTLAKTSRLCGTEEKIDLREGSRRRSTGLTLPNRWLLMVLLAHADAPGVVTRLSVPALRRLTGMTSFRITNQLKKLSDLGLIAHHQPGRYSPKAGVRRTSFYLLGLTHPVLGKRERTPTTIVSSPSSTNPKQTELVSGIVDAVMTFGVCRQQIDLLLKEYDAIKASQSIASDGTTQESKLGHDANREAKSFQEKYDNLNGVLKHALALLPITRYLNGGIPTLLKFYEAEDADWLLTSIHIDACLLLSSAWGDVKKGQLGPNQPCHDIIVNTAQRLGLKPEYIIEKSVEPSTHENHECVQDTDNFSIADSTAERASYHPLAVLSYALSHHLAKNLQKPFSVTKQFEVEAITYMLIPDFSKVSECQHQPEYQLRGYGFGVSRADTKLLRVFFKDPVDEDLKTYWRTHHLDCLSAISSEPDNSTPDTPVPADQ